MDYRYRETVYHITVLQTQTDTGEMKILTDGIEQNDKFVSLVDDHQEHTVEVRINAPARLSRSGNRN